MAKRNKPLLDILFKIPNPLIHSGSQMHPVSAGNRLDLSICFKTVERFIPFENTKKLFYKAGFWFGVTCRNKGKDEQSSKADLIHPRLDFNL